MTKHTTGLVIGCPECAWGKVAGCWRCGSRVIPRREVFAAALLANRYQNPDVAAFNRKYHAEGRSERRAHFWFRVGRLLGAAYGRRGCPTHYERGVRREIEAARAAFSKVESS